MNKSLSIILSATLGLGLSLSTPAFADHDGMGEHCKMHTNKTFEEADTNKDGTLDKEEAKAACSKNFDKMDADKDGTVSKAELNACGRGKNSKKAEAMHDKRSKEFAGADKDSDGTLTKEEAKKLPRVSKNFDAIDVDKDGTLDREEIHQFMHEHKGK
jgi:Ca2+-binding EF-hand superfamily protein